MRLPPYGRAYAKQRPRSGIQVAIGPAAWDFAERRSTLTLVLPMGECPWDFRWPSADGAIVHERGHYDDESLEELVRALLVAGNPFVLALREALMRSDPCVWYYPKVQRVTA